ncbi:MAG TPA: Nramp family divalent metal transporter [Thermoanaerobaculia bacterium]|nr:Nramp family divalent metal transporter [Thermoanaerobaculia bacterium]
MTRNRRLTATRRNHNREQQPDGVVRALGLGLVTGAADDDPSAIGTYAAAGAKLGPAFLWTAPVTFPMMFAVVYLSAKLGQVTGKGLFGVISERYPRWILYPILVLVLAGNTFEASADIGGMAAALGVIAPVSFHWMIVIVTAAVLVLQIRASYIFIRNTFRWLSLALFAYIGSALLAKPELGPVLRGTFIPTIRFDEEFLSLLVAVIGTTLSAYLYTWQSNEEVEEKIAKGKRRIADRAGTTREELKHSRRDILIGMLFSNVIMYFIVLSTASTLYRHGPRDIETAAQAAEALRPLAGAAAGYLFAAGVVAVGFLAVPVMTTGAAYDLAQTAGWKHGLSVRFGEAKKFYIALTAFALVAAAINFFGFNPMKLLVWSGIAQGFSTPPLMLMILLLTSNRSVMGKRVNGPGIRILGWITTLVTFCATIALLVTLLR